MYRTKPGIWKPAHKGGPLQPLARHDFPRHHVRIQDLHAPTEKKLAKFISRREHDISGTAPMRGPFVRKGFPYA